MSIARTGSHIQGGEITWRDARVSVNTVPIGLARGGDARLSYRFAAMSDTGRSERVVAESAGEPYLRTGNAAFDGLFAMGLDDARLDRVSQIRELL